MALTLAELFPAQFSSGGTTAVRTVQKASGANCAKMVLGGKLQAALRKGGCTQVMRASYLSTGQKIMATIGVLNLANVTDSEQAGQATGATAFIKQLPGAKGPTRNLMKGTGLEEAEIKGHYLILTWAEFTSLKAPAGPKQRAQLDAFSRALVGQHREHQPDQPGTARQARDAPCKRAAGPAARAAQPPGRLGPLGQLGGVAGSAPLPGTARAAGRPAPPGRGPRPGAPRPASPAAGCRRPP